MFEMWKMFGLSLARAALPLLPAAAARAVKLGLVFIDAGTQARAELQAVCDMLDRGATDAEVDALMSQHGVNTDAIEAARARVEVLP